MRRDGRVWRRQAFEPNDLADLDLMNLMGRRGSNVEGSSVLANDVDWRLVGQGARLYGATLVFKHYRRRSESWDHDHCEFCWAVFTDPAFPHAEGDLHEGYAMKARDQYADDQIWICRTCFEDFKDRFRWAVNET